METSNITNEASACGIVKQKLIVLGGALCHTQHNQCINLIVISNDCLIPRDVLLLMHKYVACQPHR